MNLTDRFIDNVYAFSQLDYSDELLIHAKKCLIDYLAATMAGAKEYLSVEEALLQSPLSSGNASTIIRLNTKTSPAIAALVNGISAHAVELDDGQRFGNIHPGAPVISAILAVGEAYGLKVSDILRGLLSGYESTLRLACSIQPGHKLKGFHATGPCGTIGATMGIASLLRFGKEQFKASLSAACTSASGILEMIEGDTQMMPFNAGKAASNAVVSAMIGYAGFKTPEDALGGRRGFLHCFAQDVKEELLTDFTDSYCITNYFKPYAACGHCHASIDAALILRSQNQIPLESIKKIEIQTYKLAINGHDHTVINGVNSARMSIPYSAVVALVKGSAGVDDFGEETIKDRSILDLVSKVAVSENEALTRQAPAKRMAIMTIFTDNGVFSETVDYPKGQPENPMSLDDIIAKYYMCGYSAGVSESSLNRVKEVILGDGNFPVSELMNCFL